MNEHQVRRILLGTSIVPKSAEDLAETYDIPVDTCRAILELLDRRGYVANVVTLSSPDGSAVKYYLRTEMKLKDMYDELSPVLLNGALLQSQ